MIGKENEQKKTVLTKDRKKNRRNQGFQRGWTKKTYCLHKEKKEEKKRNGGFFWHTV